MSGCLVHNHFSTRLKFGAFFPGLAFDQPAERCLAHASASISFGRHTLVVLDAFPSSPSLIRTDSRPSGNRPGGNAIQVCRARQIGEGSSPGTLLSLEMAGGNSHGNS